ncbi:hypothetical protein [Saccharothrix deserti]|uniref:hypothetical protein n=1 Tax=Saccharothrix deserti TaxID=2593674 RepID=UPI00131EA5F8
MPPAEFRVETAVQDDFLDRLLTGGAIAPAVVGLSIVQAITRAHDGDVHAEPRPGGGLAVTVTLPGRADDR